MEHQKQTPDMLSLLAYRKCTGESNENSKINHLYCFDACVCVCLCEWRAGWVRACMKLQKRMETLFFQTLWTLFVVLFMKKAPLVAIHFNRCVASCRLFKVLPLFEILARFCSYFSNFSKSGICDLMQRMTWILLAIYLSFT